MHNPRKSLLQVVGSSEPSPQSSAPSHFHQYGMHFVFEHKNYKKHSSLIS